jgi:small subunit ribosomal protein S17e
MGRIKSKLVKRIAKNIVKENPDLAEKDFDKNKIILSNLVSNKKTRNSIAGYITRLRKR